MGKVLLDNDPLARCQTNSCTDITMAINFLSLPNYICISIRRASLCMSFGIRSSSGLALISAFALNLVLVLATKCMLFAVGISSNYLFPGH